MDCTITLLGEEIKTGEETFYMVKTYRYNTIIEGKMNGSKINNVFTNNYKDAIRQYFEQLNIVKKLTECVVVIYKMNKKTVNQQIIKMLTADDIELNFIVCNYNEE